MGREAARLAAKSSQCALVEWPIQSNDEDGGPASCVIDDLCRALLSWGRIAFRFDAAREETGTRFHQEPAASLMSRAVGSLAPELFSPLFGVLSTSDATVARALFAYGGWSSGVQAAIAFSPVADDPTEVVRRLQRGLDWREEPLPAEARLLFGSGHDGGFAVVASSNPADLDLFETTLKDICG